jgi:outer membrane protein OmpA-like peptidoglycan-associated protein
MISGGFIMNTNAKLWWIAPALLLTTTLVQAGGVRMYGQGEIPQASEVADILSGGTLQMHRPKMRGISLDPSFQAETKMDQDLQKIAEPASDAIGLPVEFAFNSSEIAPAYKAQLDAVAEGIKMTNGVSVVVEGHTDAHGPEAYNANLSLLRAKAVKEYLVNRHGISVSQLVVKGYGEQAPIEASDPFAPANRRVQFRAAR